MKTIPRTQAFLPVVFHGRPVPVMPRHQRGVVMAISLIMLVLITLSGFAAMRGTTLQQHMAANLYDREQAFQSTEAAIRTAAAALASETTPEESALIARNCQTTGVACEDNPFNDDDLNTSKIQTVTAGDEDDQFTAQDNAAGQPQYVIENLGEWSDSSSQIQTANAHNYGAQGTTTSYYYYRITARSSDPAADDSDGRAQVTLQATFKQSD